MVVVRLLLVVFCLSVPPALAVTAEELRGSSSDSERETQQRQSRANTGALGDLLPTAPKSNKYGTSAAKPSATTSKKAKAAKTQGTGGAPAAAGSESPNIYIPPPRNSSGMSEQGVVTDAVKPSVAFGIRLGTWLECSLTRNTTNAESGAVELTLTADAVGTRRTLPAGTTLFANKVLNSATRRLEFELIRGITPDGQEFEAHGIGFDLQKTPGLAGVYVMDKKEVASRSVAKGVLAATNAAVSTISPGVAGAATTAATQSALNDAGQVTDNNATQAIIYVSPQPLLIRVEKQF